MVSSQPKKKKKHKYWIFQAAPSYIRIDLPRKKSIYIWIDFECKYFFCFFFPSNLSYHLVKTKEKYVLFLTNYLTFTK